MYKLKDVLSHVFLFSLRFSGYLVVKTESASIVAEDHVDSCSFERNLTKLALYLFLKPFLTSSCYFIRTFLEVNPVSTLFIAILQLSGATECFFAT